MSYEVTILETLFTLVPLEIEMIKCVLQRMVKH